MWRSALLFLVASSLWADAGGELLYWKPATGGFDYALEGGFTAPGNIRTLRPDYSFGVRAFATVEGVIGLHISGLLYGATTRDTVLGEFNAAYTTAQLPPPSQEVSAKLTYLYWHGQIRCSYPFSSWVSAHGVVRYVGYEERQFVRSASGEVRQLLQFYGAGPGLGLSSCIRLDGDWGFSMECTVLALIAEQRTDVAPLRFTHDIAVVPAMDMRIACFYLFCGFEYDFQARVGYELDYIFSATRVLLPFFDSPVRVERDAGFAGPFLQLGLCF